MTDTPPAAETPPSHPFRRASDLADSGGRRVDDDGSIAPLLDRLDRLNGNIEDLVDGIKDLAPRSEVDAKVATVLAEAKASEQRFARDRRRSQWILGVVGGVGVVLTVMVVVLTIVVISLRNQADSNAELGRSNRQLLERVNGCFVPEGECKKASDKATADFLAQLNDQFDKRLQAALQASLDKQDSNQRRTETLACAQMRQAGQTPPPEICGP